jgi:hypothetical protein
VLVSTLIVLAVAAGLARPAMVVAAAAAAVGSRRCRRRSGQASRSWGSQVHTRNIMSLTGTLLLLLCLLCRCLTGFGTPSVDDVRKYVRRLMSLLLLLPWVRAGLHDRASGAQVQARAACLPACLPTSNAVAWTLSVVD